MKIRLTTLTMALGIFASLFAEKTVQASENSVENLPLFQQAKKSDERRYQFAIDHGASVHLTPNGKSFYVLYLPPDAKADTPFIFTLHGHAGNAFNEIFLWQSECAKRGIGIIALQWWFGGGEKMDDYYSPKQISEIMETVLADNKVAEHRVLLHGFSRGSANIYGVTAFEKAAKPGQKDYVLLTVANAGKASPDFPVNKDIEKGVFGAAPFANTHWVTFGGALDPHPDRDGLAGMREAQVWVKKYGGTIDLAIEDAKSDHGGFHRNKENMKAALDVFEKLLKK